MDRVE